MRLAMVNHLVYRRDGVFHHVSLAEKALLAEVAKGAQLVWVGLGVKLLVSGGQA